MPSRQQTTLRPDQLKRSVYVIARPVKKAGSFSPLSQRKFCLCHWGLLISLYSENELDQCIQERKPWGSLFEISNDDGKLKLERTENFNGRSSAADWSYTFSMYVGKTRKSDRRIYKHGNILSEAMLTV
jgi:hypothetical protein